MQTSRRAFLALVPATVAAATAASPPNYPSAPDSGHDVNGWRVRWMDWRTPPNQHVKFGYWFAYLPPAALGTICIGDPRHWVATTTGVLQRVPDLGVIDVSRADRTWPCSLTEPDAAFIAARNRAYRLLVDALGVYA